MKKFAQENVPSALKNSPHWVLWKMEKNRKIPCDEDGRNIDHLQPDNWRDFKTICSMHQKSKKVSGIGFVFEQGSGLCGIDIDDCYSGENLTEDAQKIVDTIPGYCEISPSGRGVKIFTRINPAIVLSKNAGGFEIYTHKRFFTVTGYKINKSNIPNEPITEEVLSWYMNNYIYKDGNTYTINNNDDDLSTLAKDPLENWTIDRVVQQIAPTLKKYYDIDTYESWLKLGMILHHQGGGSLEWRDLWDDLSKPGASYDRNVLYAKWDTFRNSKSPSATTLASLIQFTNTHSKNHLKQYSSKLEEAQKIGDILEDLFDQMRKDAILTKIDREILAGSISKTLLYKFNTSLPRIAILKQTKHVPFKPKWVDEWIYNTDMDVFINKLTKLEVSKKGFDAIYNRELEDLSCGAASELALDTWKIKVINKALYLPQEAPLFRREGIEYLNLYNPFSVPTVDGVKEQDVQKVKDTILNHLNILFGKDEESILIFLDWMAFNVQNPGVKVNWCPLIIGVSQGTGKSYFAAFMQSIMGHKNVGVIDNTQSIKSGFTNWAQGKCLNVIEELYVAGQNRYEILNTIKPLITNAYISINPKGQNPYEVQNITNYMAMTNHIDALPLDKTDRRFWVKIAPFFDMEMKAKIKMNASYFNDLFLLLQDLPGACRKFMLDYKVRDIFNPKGEAPYSKDKEEMLFLNISDEEDKLIHILTEKKTDYVNENFISTKHLASIMDEEGLYTFKTRSLAKSLLKMGYVRHPKRRFLEKSYTYIWHKRDFNIDTYLKSI